MTIRLASSHGTWALPDGATVFGRSKSCDICLLDARLSRRHACFHVHKAEIEVEDLGSTNGVQVNGDRISGRRRLAHGDQLVIGPCLITVMVDATARTSEVLRALSPGSATTKLAIGDVTEPMTPALTEGDVTTGRRIDPAIAAAVSPGHMTPPASRQVQTDSLRPNDYRPPQTEAVSPRRSATSTHKPSDMVPTTDPLDAAHEHNKTVEDLKPPPEIVCDTSPSPTTDFPAHVPAPLRGRRVAAALLDAAGISLIAALAALLAAVAGWTLAAHAAGAVLRDGVAQLGPGEPASHASLAASLLRPRGLAAAHELATGMTHLPSRLPMAWLIVGVAGATLASLLSLLVGIVNATANRGGPYWHRRLDLAIVDARSGAWPDWWHALLRWALLGAVWPVALVDALRDRRGLHDRLAGTEVRQR